MTQRQLAERLGMSDKSVSKWERGVCLPDVSVYLELCGILGISVNEFLAGEDIGQESIAEKSEDNLLRLTADSSRRQRRLKRIIALLTVVSLAAVLAVSAIAYRLLRPVNSIAPLDPESAEMKTAQLLSGADGAFLYRYRTSERFTNLTIFISEYRSGMLVNKQEMKVFYESFESPGEGMLAIVPDFKTFTVKVIVADESSKMSADVPILNEAEDRQRYGRIAMQIQDEMPIRFNEEQALAALSCGTDGLRTFDLGDLENGTAPAENDYVYCFSFQFCK